MAGGTADAAICRRTECKYRFSLLENGEIRQGASYTYRYELRLSFYALQRICKEYYPIVDMRPHRTSLCAQGTRSGHTTCAGAFLHRAIFFAVGCHSPPPSVWIFTRHQTKKPTEDCLSPRKTTTIISVFSHKWWKRRGIKAPPFFFGAALDAGNRFFPSIESGKKR